MDNTIPNIELETIDFSNNKISKPKKYDLHIHTSNNSKKDKDLKEYNDYKQDFEKVIKKLYIYSLVDHNYINVKAYKELSKINPKFILGVELDVLLPKDNNYSHVIFYFTVIQKTILNWDFLDNFSNKLLDIFNIDDKKELNFAIEYFRSQDFIDDLFIIGHWNKDNKRDVSFDEWEKIYNSQKTLETTINRFNQKQSKTNKKLIRFIPNKILKKRKLTDILLPSSDCHDIQKYDIQDTLCIDISDLENEDNNIIFKKVFSVAPYISTRISSKKDNNQLITSIKLGEFNKEIFLSEKYNTIIGTYGSGKSFLLNSLFYDFWKDKDQKNLKPIQKHIHNLYEDKNNTNRYKLFSSNEWITFDDLKNRLNILVLDQIEEYTYDNITFENSKNIFKDRFHKDNALKEKNICLYVAEVDKYKSLLTSLKEEIEKMFEIKNIIKKSYRKITHY